MATKVTMLLKLHEEKTSRENTWDSSKYRDHSSPARLIQGQALYKVRNKSSEFPQFTELYHGAIQDKPLKPLFTPELVLTDAMHGGKLPFFENRDDPMRPLHRMLLPQMRMMISMISSKIIIIWPSAPPLFVAFFMITSFPDGLAHT